jgi:hypothetical protein
MSKHEETNMQKLKRTTVVLVLLGFCATSSMLPINAYARGVYNGAVCAGLAASIRSLEGRATTPQQIKALNDLKASYAANCS